MFDAEYILIVEDEPIIAMDLAETVTELGGRPVGPFAYVLEALDNWKENQIDGAILDATLLDGEVTALAANLARAGIPLVIYSGTGLPKELAAMHPTLPLVLKPATPIDVAARLANEIRTIRR